MDAFNLTEPISRSTESAQLVHPCRSLVCVIRGDQIVSMTLLNLTEPVSRDDAGWRNTRMMIGRDPLLALRGDDLLTVNPQHLGDPPISRNYGGWQDVRMMMNAGVENIPAAIILRRDEILTMSLDDLENPLSRDRTGWGDVRLLDTRFRSNGNRLSLILVRGDDLLSIDPLDLAGRPISRNSGGWGNSRMMETTRTGETCLIRGGELIAMNSLNLTEPISRNRTGWEDARLMVPVGPYGYVCVIRGDQILTMNPRNLTEPISRDDIGWGNTRAMLGVGGLGDVDRARHHVTVLRDRSLLTIDALNLGAPPVSRNDGEWDNTVMDYSSYVFISG